MMAAVVAVLGTAALLASPARAVEPFDISLLTCEAFVKFGDEDKTTVIMWLEGYYADKGAKPVIDFPKAADDLAQILAACEDAPSKSLGEAAKETMEAQE
jgi:hypothetical protein